MTYWSWGEMGGLGERVPCMGTGADGRVAFERNGDLVEPFC